MAIGIPFILWVMVGANNLSLTRSAMTHVVTPLTQAFGLISAVVSRWCFEASNDEYLIIPISCLLGLLSLLPAYNLCLKMCLLFGFNHCGIPWQRSQTFTQLLV